MSLFKYYRVCGLQHFLAVVDMSAKNAGITKLTFYGVCEVGLLQCTSLQFKCSFY